MRAFIFLPRFSLYGGGACFYHVEAFLLFFLRVGGLFCLYAEAFFGIAPPPLTKISAGAHVPHCTIIASYYLTKHYPGESWVQCQDCKKWVYDECSSGLPDFICPNCDSD